MSITGYVNLNLISSSDGKSGSFLHRHGIVRYILFCYYILFSVVIEAYHCAVFD